MSKSAADLISQARKKGEWQLLLHTALLLLLASWTAGLNGAHVLMIVLPRPPLCLEWKSSASPSAGEQLVQGFT